MVDHSDMRLGATAPIIPPHMNLLRLPSVAPLLSSPPPEYFSATTVGQAMPIDHYDMRLNDKYGCCVLAGLANAEMILSNSAGIIHNPADADVLEAYEMCNPNFSLTDHSTDVGCCAHDALTLYRDQGLPFGPGGATSRIAAFASAFTRSSHMTTRRLIQWSVVLGGGIGLGLMLPTLAQSQDTWEAAPGDDPTPWGGHFVWGIGYGPAGLWVITWGAPKLVRWSAIDAWCQEAWFVLDTDHVDRAGLLPIGLSKDALVADVMAMASMTA